MVSDFFIPIYESSFEKSKKSKLISPIQKEAEIIFCEREFVDWLRNKFGKKLTDETYPKYCSKKYFQLFIPVFDKIKNNKEFKTKKENILQQLIINAKFPSTTKHEYDVDIVEAYYKTKQLLETQFTGEQLKTKKEYLNGFLHPIQYYCTKNSYFHPEFEHKFRRGHLY